MMRKALIAVALVVVTAGCDASPPATTSDVGAPPAIVEPAILANQQTYVPGSTKARYIYTPAAGVPNGKLLVYVHGGYWKEGSAALPNFLKPLTQQGWAIVSSAYRLPARNPYGAQDVADTVEYAQRQLGISPGNTVLYGESAGGHLASQVAYGFNNGKSYGAPVGRLVLMSAPWEVAKLARSNWVGASAMVDGLFGCAVPGAPWFFAPTCSTAKVDDGEPKLLVDAGDPPTFMGGFTGDSMVLPSVGFVAQGAALDAVGVTNGFVAGAKSAHYFSTNPHDGGEEEKVVTALLAAINS